MTRKGYVEIPEAEYNELVKQSMILAALEAGGVDNWDGYDDAIEDLDE